MGEVARQSSAGKGGTLFGLFGRKRRSKKNAQSADGFSPFLLADADKMPLAKFLMIAEENFGGYPGRKEPSKANGIHPSCNVGQTPNKARLSSPTVVARLMGLESLPSSPRGKQLSVKELKKDQVVGQVCSKERDVGRKQHRKQHGYSTKGRDPFTRTTLPNFQGSYVEISKPKELSERPRLARKHIPSYINEEGCLSRHLERSLCESGALERRSSPGQNSQYDHGKKREDVDWRYSGAHGTNLKSLCEIMALSRKREGDQRELYSLNRIEDLVSMNRNREQRERKTTAHKLANGKRFVKGGSFDERVFACEKRHSTVHESRNGNGVISKLPKQSDTSTIGGKDRTKLPFCMDNPTPQGNNNARNDPMPRYVEEDSVPWTKDLKVVSIGSGMCKGNDSDGVKNIIGEKVPSMDPFRDNFRKPRKCRMEELNVGNSLGGDRIGALLEQKIMELRSLEDGHDTDASDDDETYRGRSSASILEELISALTNEQSMSYGNMDGFECDDRGNDYVQSHPAAASYREHEFEILPEAKSPCASSEVSLESDCYGPSPVSTLEPAFSRNNCRSQRIGINAVNIQDSVFTKDSPVRMQLLNACRGKFAGERASHILDSISIMYDANPCEVGAVESKPNYSREVISNVELLFANVAEPWRSKDMTESCVDSLLLDCLEELVVSSQSVVLGYPTCPGTSERSQIRRFLFDCMVEHLDLKYSRFLRSGYKTWNKMSLFHTSEKLASEVSQNINKWIVLRGKILNVLMSTELSEMPMDHAAFDMEVHDLGTEIGHALLHGLLNETLMDLSV